jgi:hypothetical protein
MTGQRNCPLIKRTITSLLSLLFSFSTWAQIVSPADSLPVSDIDIPIKILLKPFYQLAEKNVDTVFTSPNYPADWVQADCATRYKYRFRRSPLTMTAKGANLDIGFTGFYQIIGATRACVNGAVISPWTPGCGCGFEEGERRVKVGFTANFSLAPNYILRTKIKRHPPQALDKCTVCFWGQDITATVLEGLSRELDLSKKAMEDSFSSINLKPYFQQAWNALSGVYAIPSVGFLALHPKKLRLNYMTAKNDMLQLSIGISAHPTIVYERPGTTSSPVPIMTSAPDREGFSIFLEAALQYDSLTTVLNGFLIDKRFDVQEGLIKKHIIIKGTQVGGDEKGNLLIRMDFGGSHTGSFYLTGRPVYNALTKSIEVQGMDYDLKTKSLLLKTAKWLFNKRIMGELQKYAVFNLSSYYDTAAINLNTWLNKEWTKGIRGSGSVKDLKLTSVEAQPAHLLIRSSCQGKLAIQVSSIDLKF